MGNALQRNAKVYTPTVIDALSTLEKDLGGRQVIVGFLSLAPLTPDLAYILGILGDPAHGGKSLAECCAHGNILPGQLLTEIEKAAHLRGRVISSQIISSALPAVVRDVMMKAAPYEGTCNGECRGTGSVTPEPTKENPNPSPEPCETCQGTGRLVYQPKLEHQELALEMGRMLPKGQGLTINNANIAPAGGGGGGLGGALEKLTQLTDKLLYGDEADRPAYEQTEMRAPAAEGEVIDAQDQE